jgi:hypothetical protein
MSILSGLEVLATKLEIKNLVKNFLKLKKEIQKETENAKNLISEVNKKIVRLKFNQEVLEKSTYDYLKKIFDVPAGKEILVDNDGNVQVV